MPKPVKKLIESIFEFLSEFIIYVLGIAIDHNDLVSKMKRFDDPARDVLRFSSAVASEKLSDEITLVHLLIGMLRAKNSDACNTLEDFGIIESKLAPFNTTSSEHRVSGEGNYSPELSENIKRILELSVQIARKQGQSVISTSQLLIALVQYESDTVIDILKHFDVQAKDIVKRAEFYLADESTYEHSLIRQQNSILGRSLKAERTKQKIKSRLQSWGLIESDGQENG